MLSAVPAAAQGVPGPLACYLDARTTGITQTYAEQICRGATDAAPAACLGVARTLGMFTDAQAIQLCQTAKSTQPAACASRLRGSLVTADIVSYCGGQPYAVQLPAGGSEPACVEQGRTTGLADSQVLALCQGATSTEPVACVQQGHQLARLADADLVDLCRTVELVPLQVPPGVAYR